MTKSSIIDLLNKELARLSLLPLGEDQTECLNDPARHEESLAMLDDLEARCGIDASVRAAATEWLAAQHRKTQH